MKNINLDNVTYKIIKSLKSSDCTYYYTIDIKNDKEVVFLCEEKDIDKTIIYKVDEREYPILMNKFSIK
ncbi:MAG: hypothetical protein PHD03_02415 [Bacilli bacterium]|nr:hypothetical protein [Bacilli bacterium]MDD4406496.1 hypothetical protein [Bacilli bacterium]